MRPEGLVKESFPSAVHQLPLHSWTQSVYTSLILHKGPWKRSFKLSHSTFWNHRWPWQYPEKINPGPKHKKQQKFYCANRSSTIYLLPDARVFLNSYILSKEKKLTWHLGFSLLNSWRLSSSAFLGFHGHIWQSPGNTLCCFSSNKLL